MKFSKALIISSLELDIIAKNYNLFSFLYNYTEKDNIIFKFLNGFSKEYRSVYSLCFFKAIHLIKEFDFSTLDKITSQNKTINEFRIYNMCLYYCSFFIFFSHLNKMLIKENKSNDIIKNDIGVIIDKIDNISSFIETLFFQLQDRMSQIKEDEFNFDIIKNYEVDLNKFQSTFARIEMSSSVTAINNTISSLQDLVSDITDLYDIFIKEYFNQKSINDNQFYQQIEYDVDNLIILPCKINFSRTQVIDNFTTYIFFKRPYIEGYFNKDDIITNSLEIIVLSYLNTLPISLKKEINTLFSILDFATFLMFYFENELSYLDDKRELIFKAYYEKNYGTNHNNRKSAYVFRDIMSDNINFANLEKVKDIAKQTISSLNKLYNDSSKELKLENIDKNTDNDVAKKIKKTISPNDILINIFQEKIIKQIDFLARLEFSKAEKSEVMFSEGNKELSERQKQYINKLTNIIYEAFQVLK